MKSLNDKNLFSAPEAAEILGVSRITIFNWIKKGNLAAEKIGRNYVITHEELLKHVEHRPLSENQKEEIKLMVDKALKDYGETIRRLGQE